MSVIPPTKDDWLRALQDAQAPVPDSDAITIGEFADLIGMKRDGARTRMLLLVRAKKAVQTSKHIRTATGSLRRVMAYRLVTDDPA